jgi:hypothetical protein
MQDMHLAWVALLNIIMSRIVNKHHAVLTARLVNPPATVPSGNLVPSFFRNLRLSLILIQQKAAALTDQPD